jgi:GNAT superfamily N-acetyltransferase
MDRVRFDERYIERRPLPSGATLVLRLVRPSDSSLLVRGFERLSAESRYRRFFAYKKLLSPAEVKYFTDVDGINHFAIAAVIERADGSEEGVGVARFVRLPAEPLAAEAALTIIDDCQNHGIGGSLLERLLAAAAERSVRELRFSVLGINRPMLQLIGKLEGLTRRRLQSRIGNGVVELVMPVPRAEDPPQQSAAPG